MWTAANTTAADAAIRMTGHAFLDRFTRACGRAEKRPKVKQGTAIAGYAYGWIETAFGKSKKNGRNDTANTAST
jgi:hypothetical protein